MNAAQSPAPSGRVASLHLHPAESGGPLQFVEAFEVIAGNGVAGDARFFGRLSHDTGRPSRRQVTLIEREQVAEHAAALGVAAIAPGAVRSNIETTGINLIALLGQEIEIGEAVLRLYAPREPCPKMDAVCQGLRARMMNQRQGVLAEVVRSGRVRVGDTILIREAHCASHRSPITKH